MAASIRCVADRNKEIWMRRAILILVIPIVVGTLSGNPIHAQVWMDPFDYTGTRLGTWVEYRGDWQARDRKAEAEAKFRWQYALQTSRVYRDCAVQCRVDYNKGALHTLQFGGVTMRCNGPAFSGNNAGADLLMAKIQNNNFSTYPDRFDSLWIYELDALGEDTTTALRTLTPTFAGATLRMLAVDQRVVARVDTDGDGRWEHQVERIVTLPAKPGPVGIAGFGSAHVDDFKVFDAVCLDDPTRYDPVPGGEVRFQLRGAPNRPYQAAASLGRTGIPVSGGRTIPLGLDALLVLSVSNTLPTVFRQFTGVCDTKGDAAVSIGLPAVPNLKGITLYVAFVNVGNGAVLNISNEHAVTIR
jgi:hypothetical protein